MSAETTTLRLSLTAGDDLAPEELEQLTARLREDLLALDVEQVTRPTAGPAPPGAKAIEMAEVGALVITLATSPALLGQVLELVRGWMRRREPLTVSLEIGDAKLTLAGASDEERRRLVDTWVDRVLTRQPAAESAEDQADSAESEHRHDLPPPALSE